MVESDESTTKTLIQFSDVELTYLLNVLESLPVSESKEKEVLRQRLADRLARAIA